MVGATATATTHQPTKYFEGNGLSAAQEAIKQMLSAPEKLNGGNINELCSFNGKTVNRLYYAEAINGHRNEALKIAAEVIVAKGREIKDQLDRDENGPQISNSNQEKNQANQPTQPSGKDDIPKISGGTLSEIITKITEILAGKSGQDLEKGADNFSALFEVLESQKTQAKFDEVVKILSDKPDVVANIKEILKDSEGGKIFDAAIERNSNNKETSSNAEAKNDSSSKWRDSVQTKSIDQRIR